MKNLPWYISLISVIAVIILCVVLIKQCKADPAEIGYIRDSTQFWKNRAGQLVASIKQREEDFNVIEQGYKDSIAQIYNTSAKKIQEAITLTLKGKAKITSPGESTLEFEPEDGSGCPPQIKTISNLFSSPYYVATATLYATGDSSFIDLVTYDTLTVVTKVVKEGNIFNRHEYLQVDATNRNPYNHIEGLKVYRLPAPKQKKFGIGPQLGVTLDGSGKIKPYAGIGVQYSLIRL